MQIFFNVKKSEAVIENILKKALEEKQDDFVFKQTSKYLVAS